MAMRWSRWVATVPPPATAAAPWTTIELGPFLDDDAVGGEARHHRGDAVRFLDPQLADALEPGVALGEGGGDGEDRVLVDHRRRARSGGTVMPLSRVALHPDVADFLAADARGGSRF